MVIEKRTTKSHINKRLEKLERHKYVALCMRFKLSINDSLRFLKDNGFDIEIAQLERDKKIIQQQDYERLAKFYMGDYPSSHIGRIDIMEWGQMEMVKNYMDETEPFKKNKMLEQLLGMQPFLSAFYENTIKFVESNPHIKEQMIKSLSKIKNKKDNDNDNDNDNYNDNQIILEKNSNNKKKLLQDKYAPLDANIQDSNSTEQFGSEQNKTISENDGTGINKEETGTTKDPTTIKEERYRQQKEQRIF
jgi:hypothetical protein